VEPSSSELELSRLLPTRFTAFFTAFRLTPALLAVIAHLMPGLQLKSRVLGTFANIHRCNSCGVEHWGRTLSVDRARFQELLVLAERHVTEAAGVIQHQEQLIKEMRDRGDDTELALSLLEKLRTTARAMVEHQANIEKQLRKLESGDS
jgi:hypothetical protein